MREYPATKLCSRCGEDLPRSEFYKNKGRPDGIQTVCKACTKLNNRDWHARNPKAHLQYYAGRTFTDEQRAAQQRRVRAWLDANAERVAENARRWVARNPQRAREIGRKRAATRKARKMAAFVEHVEALVVLESDDGLCGICGQDVDPMSFEIDHIVPLARGGEHSYANVQPAHPACNRRKWANEHTAA